MEADLKEMFLPEFTAQEAGNFSPLALAFAGDAAYELAIRTMLLKTGISRPNLLTKRKAELAKAPAQSRMMEVIEPLLTPEESEVYGRGRNAKTVSQAKHATAAEYRRATGFEALIGWLYLCGRTERMLELISAGIESENP